MSKTNNDMASKINKKRSAVSAYVEGQKGEKENNVKNEKKSTQKQANKNKPKQYDHTNKKSDPATNESEFDIYEELTQKQKPKNVFSGFHLEPQVVEGLEALAKQYESETGMKKSFKSELVNNILKI